MIKSKLLTAAVALTLALAACQTTTETKDDDKIEPKGPSLSITSPKNTSTVDGNVVTLALAVKGIDIVKAADGDTSGKNGHFHVFVDKDPVAPGAVVPKEAGIIHTTDNPITITGLGIGEHTFKVVLGDSTHTRIGDTLASVTVSVKGPSVDIDSPTTEFTAGQDVFLAFVVQGVNLVKADADTAGSKTTGHLHLFLDPAAAPTADGTAIAKTDAIIHTTETSYTFKGLAVGEHTIWLVLGDKGHVPFGPLVADKIVITVK